MALTDAPGYAAARRAAFGVGGGTPGAAEAVDLRDGEAVKAALDAVSTQNKFEADHLNMHTTNMNNAENECQTLKNHVRSARQAQVDGGDQYPPFKVYGGKSEKK